MGEGFEKDEQKKETRTQDPQDEPQVSRRPVKPALLSWQVAEQIRAAVFRGELRAGQHLRELNLAKQFRVSQATIREALSKVEQHGLVVRTPNRSTKVVQLPPEQFREIAAVRLTLERMAFLEAAERATDQELDALAKWDAQHAGEAPGVPAAIADWEFHRQVWRLSRNATLIRILEQLTMPAIAFHSDYRKALKRGEPDNSHRELIIALRMRDRDMVSDAVERHLGDGSPAAQDVDGMMGAMPGDASAQPSSGID
jgi:DNA-binding GntR family transcriptional regulator